MLFKKKTFKQLYDEYGRAYDSKRISRLIKRVSSHEEALLLLGDCPSFFKNAYDERKKVIAMLDLSKLVPGARGILWEITSDREWLKTISLGDDLAFSLLVVQQLYLWKSFEEEEKFYRLALANAVRLGTLKKTELSFKELCLIYKYSKNQRIWNVIKEKTENFQDSVNVANLLPGNEAAYALCMSYTHTPEQLHDAPMYNTNQKLKNLYFRKAAEIFIGR